MFDFNPPAVYIVTSTHDEVPSIVLVTFREEQANELVKALRLADVLCLYRYAVQKREVMR